MKAKVNSRVKVTEICNSINALDYLQDNKTFIVLAPGRLEAFTLENRYPPIFCTKVKTSLKNFLAFLNDELIMVCSTQKNSTEITVLNRTGNIEKCIKLDFEVDVVNDGGIVSSSKKVLWFDPLLKIEAEFKAESKCTSLRKEKGKSYIGTKDGSLKFFEKVGKLEKEANLGSTIFSIGIDKRGNYVYAGLNGELIKLNGASLVEIQRISYPQVMISQIMLTDRYLFVVGTNVYRMSLSSSEREKIIELGPAKRVTVSRFNEIIGLNTLGKMKKLDLGELKNFLELMYSKEKKKEETGASLAFYFGAIQYNRKRGKILEEMFPGIWAQTEFGWDGRKGGFLAFGAMFGMIGQGISDEISVEEASWGRKSWGWGRVRVADLEGESKLPGVLGKRLKEKNLEVV